MRLGWAFLGFGVFYLLVGGFFGFLVGSEVWGGVLFCFVSFYVH